MSKINALNFAVKIVHMHTWTLHLLLFIITQISIAIFIDFKPSKVMVVFFSFFQSLYFFNLLKGTLFFFFSSLYCFPTLFCEYYCILLTIWTHELSKILSFMMIIIWSSCHNLNLVSTLIIWWRNFANFQHVLNLFLSLTATRFV